MAYTKMGRPIKKNLKAALDYYLNPNKNQNGDFVYSYMCGNSSEAIYKDWTNVIKENKNSKRENCARSLVHSFLPGEVDPETAHKIGIKFAEEYLEKELGGRFQYFISTHIDKEHIHNHIVWNNVSFIDTKCYDVTKDDFIIRKITNDICVENNLSVIDTDKSEKKYISETKKNTRKYFENMCLKKGISWKAKIQYAIDLCVEESKNYYEFISFMKALKLDINDEGKYLKVKFKEQQKYLRCKDNTLGKDYSREAIKKRIEEKEILLQKAKTKKIFLRNGTFDKTLIEVEEIIKPVLDKSISLEDYLNNLTQIGFEFDFEKNSYIYNSETRVIEIPEHRFNRMFLIDNIKNKFEKERQKTKNPNLNSIQYHDVKK